MLIKPSGALPWELNHASNSIEPKPNRTHASTSIEPTPNRTYPSSNPFLIQGQL
ncbi:uncharacterized protein DS421_11g334570 [Arachis hypogaea]|nr:uncharacterized protein DS421_11g334570 [Arachis hypogaea]